LSHGGERAEMTTDRTAPGQRIARMRARKAATTAGLSSRSGLGGGEVRRVRGLARRHRGEEENDGDASHR